MQGAATGEGEIGDLVLEVAGGGEALLQEVLALKPKYREVILLYYYQDLKISEIAQALQAPESTISVRLKRAREQLKKRLEGWEFD